MAVYLPLQAEFPSAIRAEAQRVNPDGTIKEILVLVDMQVDFLGGSLTTPGSLAVIVPVADKIRSYAAAGKQVIATRDLHEATYLTSQEGRNLPAEHCIQGTPGAELHPAILEALPEDAIVVDKPTFGSRDLMAALKPFVRQYGQTNLRIEFVGILTDICLLNNVLLTKAFYPEIPLTVDASCCAGLTPELHEAALLVLKSCQVCIAGE